MAGVGTLLKQAQKMQKQIELMQASLATREIDVTSGGGAVKIKINGAEPTKTRVTQGSLEESNVSIIRGWNGEMPTSEKLLAQSSPVFCLSFSRDGRWLAAVPIGDGRSSAASWFQPRSGSAIRTLARPGQTRLMCPFSSERASKKAATGFFNRMNIRTAKAMKLKKRLPTKTQESS